MTPPFRTILLFLLCCGWFGSSCQSQQAQSSSTSLEATGDSVYQRGPQSYDGIGKYYLGREISQVMGHQGAAWLERPERNEEESSELVVKNLELRPTDVVADIGSGTGYFSFRMAPLVPEGKVIAEDIQPEMQTLLRTKMQELGVGNVEPRLGTITDPNLASGSVDVVLMVDVYHEFSHPREMMTAIFEGLRSGGRVVLVEYRGEDPKVPIKERHKMTEKQVRVEMEAIGLKFVENRDMLPWQHFLVFQKP
jgi:precorrin-6B methylase 2